MAKFYKRMSKGVGLAPGELVHVGEERTEKIRITVIDYNDKDFQEKTVERIEECFSFKDTPSITWINIDGIHDVRLIEQLGECFEIHPLVLEDILNTNQRPKIEDYEKTIFIVVKMLMFDGTKKEIVSEQVSLILGSNFVISFQERQGDVFNAIRERLRSQKGRIRKMKADYLAYSLLDAIVDNYFSILEKLGDKIEGMEEGLIADPLPQTLRAIQNAKRDVIFLRRSVWPLREVTSGLERSESKLVTKATHPFLRDLYDHTIQVIDTIETFRDMVSGMLDIYLSSVSNKMNEVMKVLTIIATIFIPITFIAGIYGMNFNPEVSFWNMPELNWRYGYLFTWGVMVAIIVAMISYFKRKRWL
jgi:magnesium transporter